MKLGAVIPSYRMTYFLPALLQELKWLDKIVITSSSFPWDGDKGVDNTEKVLHALGQRNVEILRGGWKDQAEQRNAGLSLCRDCDYVFLLDTDEILTKRDQITLLANAFQDGSDAYACPIRTYYKDLGHRATYDEGHTPIVLVKPHVRICEIRCVPCGYAVCNDIVLHHLKFLQPREDVIWRQSAKAQKRFIGDVVSCGVSSDIEKILRGYKFEENPIAIGEYT